MNKQERELRQKLDDKTQEIERVVAKALGLGDPTDMDPTARRRLREDVELMIEENEAALHAGDKLEEWEALDQRLTETEIGRLMLERHEIEVQFLNLLDDWNSYRP